MSTSIEHPLSRTTPYTGSDLNKARHEIRLLTLLPGDATNTIQCILRKVSLDDKAEYEALSYVWGNGKERNEILVNETVVSITQSLYTALVYLRHPDEPRTLWIDALCINQGNIPERNQQVELMGKVYSSASQVLIWLGEENQAIGWAIAHMKSSREKLDRLDNLTIERIGVEVYWLQERPWFSRMWVFQEFALGKHDPLLGIGSNWIRWTEFIDSWELLYTRFTGKTNFHTSTTLLLSTLRRTFHESTGHASFWQFVIRTRQCSTTDPRDHVFALRGLLPQEEQNNILPDYEETKERVFAKFMSYLFRIGHGTKVMSYYRFMPENWEHMPSWVPDFAAQSLITTDRVDPRDLVPRGARRFVANGKILHDEKTLQIRGYNVGEIDSIFVPTSKTDRLDQLPAIRDFADFAAKKADGSKSVLARFQNKEPLWRTLVADNGARGESAPESYGTVFESLIDPGDGSLHKDDGNSSPFTPLTFSFQEHFQKRSPYPIFSTSNGFLGLGMPDIQKGDHVILIFGCSTPWALRLVHGFYRLVGQLYVSGITSINVVDKVYAAAELESTHFNIR